MTRPWNVSYLGTKVFGKIKFGIKFAATNCDPQIWLTNTRLPSVCSQHWLMMMFQCQVQSGTRAASGLTHIFPLLIYICYSKLEQWQCVHCTVHFLCLEFRTFFPARSYKGSLSEVIYPWDHLFRNAAQISQIMLMSYSSYLSELKWKILQTRYICHSPTSNN